MQPYAVKQGSPLNSVDLALMHGLFKLVSPVNVISQGALCNSVKWTTVGFTIWIQV